MRVHGFALAHIQVFKILFVIEYNYFVLLIIILKQKVVQYCTSVRGVSIGRLNLTSGKWSPLNFYQGDQILQFL